MPETLTVMPMTQDRYHRQQLLPRMGAEGQSKLAASRILLIGCGALGTVIAEQLVRAGIGFLRICDRDLVELTNLQRQVLFDERDARDELPKAIAAARRLHEVNSTVPIDARVVDVHRGNLEALIGEGTGRVHLILDGTDNVQTRYLVNDAAVKLGIPWVYGACVGTEGRVMGIVPDGTPCLRCIFNDPPLPGELATCDTAGVLASAASLVASLQAVTAMKILLGERRSRSPGCSQSTPGPCTFARSRLPPVERIAPPAGITASNSSKAPIAPAPPHSAAATPSRSALTGRLN